MTAPIRLVVEFAIADGKMDEFKALLSEAIETSQTHDPDALGSSSISARTRAGTMPSSSTRTPRRHWPIFGTWARSLPKC